MQWCGMPEPGSSSENTCLPIFNHDNQIAFMRKPAFHNLITAALATLLLPLTATAQQADLQTEPVPVSPPLFTDHTPLSVTIEAPLTTLMTIRPDEEYLDGTFSYTTVDGTAQTFDLKIRTRGNFRRKEEHCDFAPIRLNFRKKQIEGTLFEGQDKLKLVTHCDNGNTYFDQLVLREYLAYRFYQAMTEQSFGVRLFQVTYVNTEDTGSLTRIGFVIEDDEDVADRIGLKRVKTGDIMHGDLDRQAENLVNVFQYMIGNTDYSLVRGEPDKNCCHNIELMSATGEAPYIPVPFDFDFAGLVNAPYAAPNVKFHLRNVRQRLYRGQCRNNDLLPGTFKLFLDKRTAFQGILDDIEYLSGRTRKDVPAFLNVFFERISSQKKMNSAFINKCVDSE